jgi:hypothetical protein
VAVVELLELEVGVGVHADKVLGQAPAQVRMQADKAPQQQQQQQQQQRRQRQRARLRRSRQPMEATAAALRSLGNQALALLQAQAQASAQVLVKALHLSLLLLLGKSILPALQTVKLLLDATEATRLPAAMLHDPRTAPSAVGGQVRVARRTSCLVGPDRGMLGAAVLESTVSTKPGPTELVTEPHTRSTIRRKSGIREINRQDHQD